MSRKYFAIVMIVTAVVAFAFMADARAEVLFSDSFDTSTTPDSTNNYCLNTDLSSRLGGTLAGGMVTLGTAWDRAYYDGSAVTWPQHVQVNNASWGANALGFTNEAIDWKKPSAALIQYNFNTSAISNAGEFTIRFDADPIAGITGTTARHGGGVGVYIGATDGNQSTILSSQYASHPAPDVDFGLHILDDGRVNITDAGFVSLPTMYYDQARYDSNPTTYAQEYTFEVRISYSPLDGIDTGKNATAEFWVISKDGDSTWNGGNPFQVDLNPNDANSKVYTFTWDGPNNYIGFDGFIYPDAYSYVDNVSVSSPIPEPSTIALLATGLIGLLAYAWRKRK